jgi:hypothetical protein
VKTAFTRRYNKEGGFLPYSIVQHAKKKAASAEVSEFGEEVIFNLLKSSDSNHRVHCRGLQGDFVYLSWPIAPLVY